MNNRMRMFKKIIVFTLIVLLCFLNTSMYLVRAQEITEATPTPAPETVQTVEETPTPDPSSSPESSSEATPTPAGDASVDNSADVTDNIDSTSDTGDNQIDTLPTPTPTPSESPSSEPSPDVSAASSENQESSSSVEEGGGGSGEPTSSSSPSSGVNTGDSVSVVDVENNVNTNIVNSVFLNHTLNIFLPQDGKLSAQGESLDLSLLATNAVNKVFETDQKTEEQVSVAALDINNFAYVENDILSNANTGGNDVLGGESATINTGNAYSIVSVFNNVNTNIVNSTFHLVTINIFGDVSADIILPELNGTDSSCPDCFSDLNVENSATVENNVTSSANTGGNTILLGPVASGSAKIDTGDAQSIVNVFNLVNTNWVDVVFKKLYINTFGTWDGSFLGWGDILGSPDKNLDLESSTGQVSEGGCTNCYSDLNVQNSANVVNNIDSTASTGGNNIMGGWGVINTGNAYSSITLANFINSNIFNSQGFVGFINIFGSLVGNIGGFNAFADEEPTEEEPEVLQNGPDYSNTSGRDYGGELVMEASHNVGDYVLPGDTITFIVKVKNPGHGPLYDTMVYIELIKDNVSYGGSYFNLGDIKPFKSLTLSTGLVLSEYAQGGNYIARVTADGIVAPDDHLSQSVDLPFTIAAYSSESEDNGLVAGASASDETLPPSVLGVNTKGLTDIEKKIIAIFSGLLFIYLMGRGYQKREKYVFPVAKKVGDYALRIGSLFT